MEDIRTSAAAAPIESSFVFDTTFVLCFLSADLGQRGIFSLDGIVMALALGAVMLLPFALETNGEAGFGRWVAERGLISLFGLFAGVAFSASLGSLFPESLESLPFTLLIMASMATCFLSFASLLGFRISR